MIELDFYIYVFSMELRSFEKPYVALLNSSNWATGGPLWLKVGPVLYVSRIGRDKYYVLVGDRPLSFVGLP
jgi:hypothetical protein